MKRLPMLIAFIFLLLIGLFGLGLMKGNSKELKSAVLGQSLPTFTAPLLDINANENVDAYKQVSQLSKTISSMDLKGPALINVFASWCPSCYEEHGSLLKLQKQGVNIYGLNYKDEPKRAWKMLQQQGNPFTHVIVDENGDIGFELGVYGAPETFVIDENQVVVYKYVGVIDDEVWNNELSSFFVNGVSK